MMRRISFHERMFFTLILLVGGGLLTACGPTPATAPEKITVDPLRFSKLISEYQAADSLHQPAPGLCCLWAVPVFRAGMICLTIFRTAMCLTGGWVVRTCPICCIIWMQLFFPMLPQPSWFMRVTTIWLRANHPSRCWLISGLLSNGLGQPCREHRFSLSLSNRAWPG